MFVRIEISLALSVKLRRLALPAVTSDLALQDFCQSTTAFSRNEHKRKCVCHQRQIVFAR